MAENQKGILLAVAKLDRKICITREKKVSAEKKLLQLTETVNKKQQQLKHLESEHKVASLKQAQEEERLRLEEQKIIERRKQISAMGGAKSAKFAERDVDMASKAIESMEQAALELMEVVDRLGESLAGFKDSLIEAELVLNKENEDMGPVIIQMAAEIEKSEIERRELLPKLENQTKNLYLRVSSRYQADPLSIVSEATCKACHRTLPVQVYNNVLTGDDIVQCPGCSRILVAEVVE